MALDPAIAREYLRRRAARVDDDGLRARLARMLEGVHPKALRALRSTALLLAFFCTRRAGKSRSLVRRMAEVATTVKDARVIYINETRAECERIAWLGNGRDGLLTLNDEFELGGKPNQSKLSMWFPRNGGLVEFVGADDQRAVNKLVGIAPHLVVIDEAQKLPHLVQLLRHAIGPAMMDHSGQIVLAGTPGLDLFGAFYEATREDDERDASWEVHTFSVVDNPFFGDTEEERYERAIVSFCRQHNLELDSPEALRAWGPKWVKEDANYVWHVHRVPEHELCYAPERLKGDGSPDIEAALADLPDLPRGEEWQFTLGCDLGFDPDPFAVVVWAWSYASPAIYEVTSFARLRLDTDAQRDVIDSLERSIGFAIIVADAAGGGKAAVSGWSKEWSARWGKPIIEAQKSRKHEHIELLNGDLRGGKIKLRRDGYLIREAKRATWMAQTGIGRLRENPMTPNDAMDAALYSHRHTMAYLHEPKMQGPKAQPDTRAANEALERRLEDDEDDMGYAQESYYS